MKNEFLGKSATDKVTGYSGTVTAYAEYLAEEPRVLIESVDATGSPIEWWSSLERLEIKGGN